jgi:hypothetical protein
VFWEWPSPLKHLRVMDVSIVSKTVQYHSDHVFICVLDAEAATRDLRSQCVRSCDAHFWKLPRWHRAPKDHHDNLRSALVRFTLYHSITRQCEQQWRVLIS